MNNEVRMKRFLFPFISGNYSYFAIVIIMYRLTEVHYWLELEELPHDKWEELTSDIRGLKMTEMTII